MYCARRTPSCCETDEDSIVRRVCSSVTVISPVRSNSRIRILVGCANALKRSDLKPGSDCFGNATVLALKDHYLSRCKNSTVFGGVQGERRLDRKPVRDAAITGHAGPMRVVREFW